MKNLTKLLACLLFVFALSPVHANTYTEQGFPDLPAFFHKIQRAWNQKVKEIRQAPEEKSAVVKIIWKQRMTVPADDRHFAKPHVETVTFTTYCNAYFTSYTEKHHQGDLTVAIHKDCLDAFKKSPKNYFTFFISLGRFGQYVDEKEGETPYTFQLTTTKDKISTVVQSQTVNTNDSLLVFRLHVESNHLRSGIKEVFDAYGQHTLGQAFQFIQKRGPSSTSRYYWLEGRPIGF